MHNALGMPVLPLPVSKKTAARAGLVDLKEPARKLLNECFRQFGIEPVALSGNAAERFKKEKFEACVVRLGPAAHGLMEGVRTSASNSRMVIYGVGGSAQDALQYSKYGINALLKEPLERQATLNLVRATQTLVLHEFRRYVRIPLITEVSVTIEENRQLMASSVEISSGGMSLHSTENIPVGKSVEVSFALLTLPRIWSRGTITWHNVAKQTFGVRFDPQDPRRQKLKQWVEAYLEG